MRAARPSQRGGAGRPGRALRTAVRHGVRHGVRQCVRHGVLLGLAAVWLLPTLGLFVTSLRPPADIAASGWWHVLRGGHLTLANYADVLTVQGFARNLLNSFLIAIPSTVLPIALGALAAYALAWQRFRGRDAVFLAVVALLVVPLQLTWIPVLRLFGALGLTGSFVGLWLAHTAYGLPFAVFLLHSFMAELPPQLFESARVDGASELRVFLSVVLPLSRPALASLAIFQFVWVWNDLINALVFLQDRGKYPLTAAIQSLLGSYGSQWHLLAAGSFVSMSMPLLVFLALQRHFIRGLTAGAIKG